MGGIVLNVLHPPLFTASQIQPYGVFQRDSLFFQIFHAVERGSGRPLVVRASPTVQPTVLYHRFVGLCRPSVSLMHHIQMDKNAYFLSCPARHENTSASVIMVFRLKAHLLPYLQSFVQYHGAALPVGMLPCSRFADTAYFHELHGGIQHIFSLGQYPFFYIHILIFLYS